VSNVLISWLRNLSLNVHTYYLTVVIRPTSWQKAVRLVDVCVCVCVLSNNKIHYECW